MKIEEQIHAIKTKGDALQLYCEHFSDEHGKTVSGFMTWLSLTRDTYYKWGLELSELNRAAIVGKMLQELYAEGATIDDK